MYRGLVCIMRFRIAISICAIASSRRWYDFHTSFGKQVAFYQEVPQYRHIGWVGGGGQTQTYTRAHRSNFSRLSLCLCFKPIPFVWLIYGAARLFHRERSGESIRCRSCEMIRWNLYSRGEYSLLFLSRCFEDRWDRCCIRRWRNCWKKERMISPRDRWIYF